VPAVPRSTVPISQVVVLGRPARRICEYEAMRVPVIGDCRSARGIDVRLVAFGAHNRASMVDRSKVRSLHGEALQVEDTVAFTYAGSLEINKNLGCRKRQPIRACSLILLRRGVDKGDNRCSSQKKQCKFIPALGCDKEAGGVCAPEAMPVQRKVGKGDCRRTGRPRTTIWSRRTICSQGFV
jgi:hypothetical protein